MPIVAAEHYLSTMADCIGDVRFARESNEFQLSYAGGTLGRCSLRRAKVSAMSWSVTESDDLHIVVLQRAA